MAFRSMLLFTGTTRPGNGKCKDGAGLWHSQDRQDEFIARLLRGKRDGFFVDLAANEPVCLSNTRALERDYGWNGVCIDANEALAFGLMKYRNCSVVAAVVSSKEEDVTFRRFLSLAAAGHAYSGEAKNKDWELGLSGIAKLSKTPARPQRTVLERVPAVSLARILQQVSAPSLIDYLSLDVQGAEERVLKRFPFDSYRFQVISVERPTRRLAGILRANRYVHLCDNSAFDELWVHQLLRGDAREMFPWLRLPNRTGVGRCMP